jgi:hypothetical protein
MATRIDLIHAAGGTDQRIAGRRRRLAVPLAIRGLTWRIPAQDDAVSDDLPGYPPALPC